MYDRLCGMTGTATDSRDEFWQTYGLRMATVPVRSLPAAPHCQQDISEQKQNGRPLLRKSSEFDNRVDRS